MKPQGAGTTPDINLGASRPAGEHDVIWRFEPRFYLWGLATTLLSLLLIGASLSVLLRRP